MKRLTVMLLLLALLTLPAFAAEGEPLRAAIIDTGISTAAVAPERILPGKNYLRPEDGTEDRLGHGTAVAAIIAGSASAGVSGLCTEVQLVPLVYCTADQDGRELRGDAALAAQAIRDAVDLYACRIINLSSGAAADSPALRAAAEYAAEKGVLLISSAGNTGVTAPERVYYPGGYESVLCVGACDKAGRMAAFSQKNDTVDLLAPGEDLRLASVRGKRYRGEGTSFSAAYVTGAAARLWTAHPDWTAAQVRSALLFTARTVDGWPVLDLDAAEAADLTLPFFDAAEGAYYGEALRWAAERGIAETQTALFWPERACTRGELALFLYRAAGSPAAAQQESGFSDLPTGGELERAVCWAVETGVTKGVGEGHFAPELPCDRAQIVTFLWRALGLPQGGDAGFSDTPAGAWYYAAVCWAVETGVTKGVGEGRFAPELPCDRAQTVTLLWRAYVPAE